METITAIIICRWMVCRAARLASRCRFPSPTSTCFRGDRTSATSGSYPINILGRQGNATASSTVNFTIGGERDPFPGTGHIPGVIQAENFDNGGNYVGYFNLDPSDMGSAPGYRPGRPSALRIRATRTAGTTLAIPRKANICATR